MVEPRPEQERLLAGWGDLLGQFAVERGVVSHVAWSDLARPSGMRDHITWLEADERGVANDVAVSSYRELLDVGTTSAINHEAVVTITVARDRLARNRAGGGSADDQLRRALVTSTEALLRALRSAGLRAGDPLDPRDIQRLIRARIDPVAASPRPRKGRLVERLALVGPSTAGPLALETDWRHLRVDGAFHRTWWIGTWPRLAVPPAWLEPFLSGGGLTRSMTVYFQPVPTHQSRRRIERDLVKLESDAVTKEEKGRRVDARHRRATQALLDREEELVAGYPEMAYLGLVTVSATTPDELDEHSEIVEQLAREAGMDLRVLDARQDIAWAAALPPWSRSLDPGGVMTRSSLRLSYHRGTTAHVASIYPFSVQGSLGHRGTYVGLDLLAGGAEFCWDPFEAYSAGLVTNPNGWVLGEPGNGKSALIKCLLWRQTAVYGTGPNGRWTAIADPKGEYAVLAEHLGLTVVKLSPGGSTTINPLAPGPAAAHESEDKQILRRAEMCAALVATVLERSLTQLEDAVVFAAVEQLTASPVAEPTLSDVARLVASPTEAMVARLRAGDRDLAAETSSVAYALDKLLSRSLRGMFDGRSTVPLRWDGPGIVLDLSAVPLESDALPLVMVAAAGWFQQLMACPGPQRVQVLDEAWALLGNRHTAGYLQTCFKLGRTYGVANLCVTHRASDLVAQADDGTATSKIAAGLLADSATKIILRQAPDQIEAAVAHFGLTGPEAAIVGQLTRGRALWKLGGRTAVVQHVLSPGEGPICDTDARMNGTAPAPGAEAA